LKQIGHILRGKDKEVNKKGKYMREKKEAGIKKQKEASDKVNTHIELKSTMF